MSVKTYIQAARLRTLPLAISGAITGNLLAYSETGNFNPSIFALSLLTSAKTSYIASSIVRDVIRNNGDYTKLVPKSVRVKQ